MLDNILTRRAVLANLAAFIAVAVSACNAPQTGTVQTQAAAGPPPPGIRIGAIDVDTAPLLAQVGNPTAAWAQQALPGQFAQALASRMAPGAPGAATLNVRINSIYLGGGGPADPDSMTGVARLNGRQTRLRATSTYIANPTDQALPEQALPRSGPEPLAGVRLLAATEDASLSFPYTALRWQNQQAPPGGGEKDRLAISATTAAVNAPRPAPDRRARSGSGSGS